MKKYRFAPATINGKPVPVELNVEVNMQFFYGILQFSLLLGRELLVHPGAEGVVALWAAEEVAHQIVGGL